ncbi:hypothetical protein [Brevibacillus sp. 179-C9.3 HS]
MVGCWEHAEYATKIWIKTTSAGVQGKGELRQIVTVDEEDV